MKQIQTLLIPQQMVHNWSHYLQSGLPTLPAPPWTQPGLMWPQPAPWPRAFLSSKFSDDITNLFVSRTCFSSLASLCVQLLPGPHTSCVSVSICSRSKLAKKLRYKYILLIIKHNKTWLTSLFHFIISDYFHF